ncbi:Pfam:Acid_phosphat_A [Seminavis robusta]|uniref:Pfam:Acid_phosphat_A n=1 Tax=Seminavis robusta TaxID=568900 RepID=A0A9N8HCI4_9STRA|nr:Pfam:Acid_phosphat_A [Seminavis robusta]|eukprot:Sro383_g131300.1 Pfam:Acid_phosphat_A (578) ;mRNA; r:28637-30712
MKFHATLLVVLLATTSVAANERQMQSPIPNGDWYTTYSKYPEYCSTPDMMAERKIPSVQQDSRLGETRLVHVTTVIRHGARTPDVGGYQCWEGYWDNPETGVWNCDLKTQMAQPTPVDPDHSEVVLFEKQYDALLDPDQGLSNGLFGTCQTGQLIQRGYDQQIENGRILRDAYCYDADLDVIDHDPRMRLMDVNAQDNKPWNEPQLHLRSDDDQRVLVSGQTLVRSMFGPEIKEATNKGRQVNIPVHLADRDKDVISIRESTCPRLTEIRENLEKSSIFKRYNNSKEAREIYKFVKKELKIKGKMSILECLMTTVCTDRPLPDVLDYEKSDMFDRMASFAYQGFNMHLLANNAEYSKLAMAPLWAEIMDKINLILNGDKHSPATRLALISAHDDTVASLMATLGIWKDDQWPPYATMFLIEIHEIIDSRTDHAAFPSKFAFRLVHDGQVLTQKIKGCLDDAELCDINVFTDLVAGFSSRDRNCKPKRKLSSDSGGGALGPFYSFLLLLVGSAIGGAGMSYYLTGSIPFWKGNGIGRSSDFSGMSLPPVGYSDDPAADSANGFEDDADKNNGGITFLE